MGETVRSHRTADPKFASADLCPDVLNHTPMPRSYMARYDWAQEMTKTHAQRRCPRCGFLVIWVPRSTGTRATTEGDTGG